jgi:O-antigen/teichoic acid export membrane protein
MLKYLRQLGSESLVYGLAGVITRFITIFLVPLYTRALTPADYGTMSLVRNTTALLGMCSSLALDSAAHRFYWDTEDPAARKSTLACWTWCHLVITLLAAAVVVVFSKELAARILGSDVSAGSLRLAAWTLPLNVLGIVYMNRLRMERRPWTVMWFALITSLLTVFLTVLFVLPLKRGVEGAFLAPFIVAIGTSVFVVGWFRDWINPKYFDWSRLKAMLHYAIPLVPTAVAFWVVDVIDRYFLQVYASTSEVGVYEIGYSIAAVVALGTMAFQQAWIPFALSIQGVDEAREVYANTLVAYMWMGCVACSAASILAPEALRLLTTKAYYGAGTVVSCLAFSYLLMGATNIAALGAAVTKRTISMGVAVIIGAIANIILNFWLVPAYGRYGAALATLLASAIVPVYLFRRSQQLYFIPYRFGRPLVILMFSLLLIRIGSAWNFDSIWLGITAKLLLLSLFVPLLPVLRIVTTADLRNLFKRAFAPPIKETV